jgi:two-component system NtrC family response regulator
LTGHGSIESALESGHKDAFQYLLKPVDYDHLVTVIQEAYEKKTKLQEAKFQEQLEELHRHGMGARGMKQAIAELRKIYGFE